MTNRKLRLKLAILAGLVPSILIAQIDKSKIYTAPPPLDLVTDRPDFTESAVVVPLGHIQVESGLTWKNGDDGTDVISGPEILVRWTVVRRFELRFGLPDFVDVADSGGPSGFGDGSVGAKVQFGPAASGWDLAAIATLSLPTGEDELTSDAVDPEFILVASRDLNKSLSVGVQFTAAGPTNNDDRDFEWGGTLVFGKSINQRWGGFAELAAIVPESGTAPILAHHGYTYQPRSNLQIDVHGGIGLSSSAPDFFVGGGFSVIF